MTSKPTISIVTPVYNGMPQIHRTLEAMARQTVPFEHLVMDACSTDGTAAAVREYESRYNVRLVSEPDEGLFDAVSKGFGRTQGEILGWLAAGDFYTPYTLAVVQQVFAAYPDVEWITGIPGYFFEERGIVFSEPVAPVYLQEAVRRGWHNGLWLPTLQQESMFWRRSLWDRAGGAELLRGQGRGKGFASDYQLWRRFAEHARPATVCSPLAAFAHHPGQYSERFARQYLVECGVKGVPKRCFRPTFYLWLFYCLLRMRSCIKGHYLK
ncbi:MAG TPA: glycosyltransferase [Candidatus Limnocylindria bacterium]|jgi:glycosyltransferase involved in cell wall biosynthesis|nr:glycosyltransferase [Candidatus Limnocylindria bacterium]